MNPPHSVTPSASKIVKCVIDDKPIYTQGQCGNNVATQSVEIHETAGVVSPSRETVNQLMRRQAEMHRQEFEQMRPTVVIMEATDKKTCSDIADRINYLDSLARQPQLGYVQDDIRQERALLRDRQSREHCYSSLINQSAVVRIFHPRSIQITATASA